MMARVVESLARHLASARDRVVAACRENRDIASLSRWSAREAADALADARVDVGAATPGVIWHAAAPMFLLAAEPGTPSTPPHARDSDLWIDVVAVPSASSADVAAQALSAGRARFLRLRDSRRAGAFATVAIAFVRSDEDLRTIDRLIAELGPPAARHRFGGMAGDGAVLGEVLAWRVS
jgi:hypothetical protein